VPPFQKNTYPYGPHGHSVWASGILVILHLLFVYETLEWRNGDVENNLQTNHDCNPHPVPQVVLDQLHKPHFLVRPLHGLPSHVVIPPVLPSCQKPKTKINLKLFFSVFFSKMSHVGQGFHEWNGDEPSVRYEGKALRWGLVHHSP
jgi:hypothetical protein